MTPLAETRHGQAGRIVGAEVSDVILDTARSDALYRNPHQQEHHALQTAAPITTVDTVPKKEDLDLVVVDWNLEDGRPPCVGWS